MATGGDSGIGRAGALLFAKEGADVAIVYLNEHEDAHQTAQRIEELGGRALKLAGNIGVEAFCQKGMDETREAFGQLDILVNNAATQDDVEGGEALTPDQVEARGEALHFKTQPGPLQTALISGGSSERAMVTSPGKASGCNEHCLFHRDPVWFQLFFAGAGARNGARAAQRQGNTKKWPPNKEQ